MGFGRESEGMRMEIVDSLFLVFASPLESGMGNDPVPFPVFTKLRHPNHIYVNNHWLVICELITCI